MVGLSKPPSALSTKISSWSSYLERSLSSSIFFKMLSQILTAAFGRLPPIAAFHILTSDSSSGRHCPGIGQLQSHAKPIPNQQQYPGALQPKEDNDFVSYSVFPFRLLVAEACR